MKVRALLLSTTALVLMQMGASAAPHFVPAIMHPGGAAPFRETPRDLVTLYRQMKRDAGVAIVSDDFDDGSFDSYDDQGADDFVVPQGETWIIQEVMVPGQYFNGEPRNDGVNVFIYKNDRYMPGELKAQVLKAPLIDNDGSFVLDVGRIRLNSGRYWLSVQDICDFLDQGEWGWETSKRQVDNPAVWRSRGGFGCTEWNTLANCIGSYGQGPDFMFVLKGKHGADTEER